jgi:hypothetical protein
LQYHKNIFKMHKFHTSTVFYNCMYYAELYKKINWKDWLRSSLYEDVPQLHVLTKDVKSKRYMNNFHIALRKNLFSLFYCTPHSVSATYLYSAAVRLSNKEWETDTEDRAWNRRKCYPYSDNVRRTKRGICKNQFEQNMATELTIKTVCRFHTGKGWQTSPAVNMNTVLMILSKAFRLNLTHNVYFKGSFWCSNRFQ